MLAFESQKTCGRCRSCRIVVLSELYAILLEDILVLLQKQDERLILKFHGKNQASAADAKNIFSPVIKLSTVLVRPVATGESSAGFRDGACLRHLC